MLTVALPSRKSCGDKSKWQSWGAQVLQGRSHLNSKICARIVVFLQQFLSGIILVGTCGFCVQLSHFQEAPLIGKPVFCLVFLIIWCLGKEIPNAGLSLCACSVPAGGIGGVVALAPWMLTHCHSTGCCIGSKGKPMHYPPFSSSNATVFSIWKPKQCSVSAGAPWQDFNWFRLCLQISQLTEPYERPSTCKCLFPECRRECDRAQCCFFALLYSEDHAVYHADGVGPSWTSMSSPFLLQLRESEKCLYGRTLFKNVHERHSILQK